MPSIAENPFLQASPLDYGLPPFGHILQEHYAPAFAAGMEQQRAEVEAIAADPAEPTFANTVAALETSGALLSRVAQVFFNLIGSSVTEGLREIEAEVAPKLAAHHDAVLMDPRLHAKVAALWARQSDLGLDGEQKRVLERYFLDQTRAGAGLGEAEQARLREINQELSRLGTDFRNRLQADTNELAVHLSDAAALAGLPDDAVAAAAAAAAARGQDGYLLTLSLFTRQPALSALRDRAVRERLFQASVSRGRRGNAHDTRELVVRTARLRAERAALLGYPHHAAYVVADQTAGTVDAVMAMLTGLVGPAVANAGQELQECAARMHADGVDGELRPWDWPYYAELVAGDRFALDSGGLRPWFELNRVLQDGVFAAAKGLYGLTFEPRPDLPRYHPDVHVYEVFDGSRAGSGEKGPGIGLFVADWYSRDSKRGGAWMSSFVDQSTQLGQRPVVVINHNVPHPPAGQPTLLTLDEVRTTFHEFGHALHGLLSDVRYPRLSGTSVPRDFVEYPSQVNEMWAWEPDLLRRYAVHHETGEPLSEEVRAGVMASQSYGQGYATTEILAAMLLDQAWHQRPLAELPGTADEVEAFEAAALAEYGLAGAGVPPRYGSTYFAHVFAGGYSAGYYSYLWSEVLDADTEEWFYEHGGLERSSGERFRRELLSRGGTVEPMAAYAAVLGRGPRVEPLLERRGLVPPEEPDDGPLDIG